MSTKLTLSIDREVIEKAKKYAKVQGRSLSNIIEEYLKSISGNTPFNEKTELSNILKELKGSIAIPNDSISYKKILEDALLDKYLKK